MLEHVVGNINDSSVNNRMITWIKLFRQVVPVAGLKEGKDFFDLLRHRGYNVNTLASVIQAAATYNKWLADLNGDHDLMYKMVDIAAKTVTTGTGSQVLSEMLSDDLPLDLIIEIE